MQFTTSFVKGSFSTSLLHIVIHVTLRYVSNEQQLDMQILKSSLSQITPHFKGI